MIPIDRPCDQCLANIGEALTENTTGVMVAYCGHRMVAAYSVIVRGVITTWLIKPAATEEQARDTGRAVEQQLMNDIRRACKIN